MKSIFEFSSMLIASYQRIFDSGIKMNLFLEYESISLIESKKLQIGCYFSFYVYDKIEKILSMT
jgi:hypothetical protein